MKVKKLKVSQVRASVHSHNHATVTRTNVAWR